MPLRRCDDNVYILGNNLSGTGPAVLIRGGQYLFAVDGTVGASVLSLQVQGTGGAWSDLVNWGVAVKFTALPGCLTGIDLPTCNVRLAATGGAPSGLNAFLIGLG